MAEQLRFFKKGNEFFKELKREGNSSLIGDKWVHRPLRKGYKVITEEEYVRGTSGGVTVDDVAPATEQGNVAPTPDGRVDADDGGPDDKGKVTKGKARPKSVRGAGDSGDDSPDVENGGSA